MTSLPACLNDEDFFSLIEERKKLEASKEYMTSDLANERYQEILSKLRYYDNYREKK